MSSWKIRLLILGDPVSMVLRYLASVKIFVIRIKCMDKYLLHFVCVCLVIFVNKSARLFAGAKFIILR